MRRSGWFLFSILWMASPVHAATYYVTTTGSDSNTCAQATHPSTAKRNPMNAVPCLGSGDTLHIVAGTYTGGLAAIYEPTVNIPNGPSPAQPTIIEGEGVTDCARLESCLTIIKPTSGSGFNLESPQNVLIRKLEIDNSVYPVTDANCLRIGGTYHDVTIEDVEIHDCWDNGIFAKTSASNRSTNLILTRVNIWHAGWNGVTVNPGHGTYLQGDNTLIQYSDFHDNGKGTLHNNIGTQCYASEAEGGQAEFMQANNCTVHHSRMWNNDGNAFVCDGRNCRFYNNIVYGNWRGIEVGYAGTSPLTGTQFYNNIIYNNTGFGIGCGQYHNHNPQSCDLSNNLVVGNGTNISLFNSWTNSGSNNRIGGSLTDCTISTSDFHHKVGSLCLDAGKTLALVTDDYDGVLRPQGLAYDIGAYEQGSGDVTPPDPPTNLRITQAWRLGFVSFRPSRGK